MALLGDGTIGSGTIASPQDMGEPVDLMISSALKTILVIEAHVQAD